MLKLDATLSNCWLKKNVQGENKFSSKQWEVTSLFSLFGLVTSSIVHRSHLNLLYQIFLLIWFVSDYFAITNHFFGQPLKDKNYFAYVILWS